MIKHKTQTETDCKVGWAVQKPIPSFRTQSLKTSAGYLPWNPVVVKVSRISSGWRLPTPTKACKKTQSCIPNGP